MKLTLFFALSLSAVLSASVKHVVFAAPQPASAHTRQSDTKATPDQSAVAAKKSFAVATAAAAKGALDAKDMSGAQKLTGKTGAFQGTVSAVYAPKSHTVVILNFDPNYRQAMTAVVRPAAYAKLPDLAALKGRHILVRGKFESYKGKPEIEITDMSQVKLLP